MTVSSDKDKFGIRLRADPDNQVLGKRLKGAFKQVVQAIKGEMIASLDSEMSTSYSYVLILSPVCLRAFV